jgi:protein involved in polysaccharide export with SLBB domain
MHRPIPSRLLVWIVALFPLLCVGCSTGGRGATGFSLFPQGHKLLDSTKELRWANAEPLQVPRELEKQPLPTYIVEPGDVLLVQPANLDSPARIPGDQPVLLDGTINLGQYGHLLVAGKTVPEIQSMVQSAVVAQTKDAGYMTVRLVSRVSKVYYVLGEVNSPGSFPLAGRETVLDALMAAGGLTSNASPENIVLSRPSKPNCCRTVLPVCYRQIVQLGDTTTNYQIAPGDRIYVPSRTLCESLFGDRATRNQTPCCGTHTPCVLPPYQPGPCPDGAGCAGPSPVDLPRPVAPAAVLPPPVPPPRK